MLYKRQSLSSASDELYGETEKLMVPESKEVPNKNDGANQKGTEANLKPQVSQRPKLGRFKQQLTILLHYNPKIS